MRSIGTYMALFGVISSVLSFLGRNLTLLLWIDNWGTTVGWCIRIGLIVLGLLLMFLAPAGEEEDTAEA